MSMYAFLCYVWWFALGAFAGWSLWWLYDKAYRRAGATADVAIKSADDRATQLGLELETARKDLSLRTGEADKLKSELSSSRDRHSSELGSIQGLLSTARTDLGTSRKQSETHAAETARLKADLEAQTKRSAANADEIAQLKARLLAAQTKDTEIDRLKSDLVAARDGHRHDVGSVQGLLSTTRAELDGMRAQRDAQAAEIAKLKVDIEANTRAAATSMEGLSQQWAAAQAKDAEIDRLRGELQREQVRAGGAAFGFVAQRNGVDDLEIVEGIGPKIASILRGAGIETFAGLASTPVARLKDILEQAGPRYRLADPGTWPRQAQLCVDANWSELHSYQDRLTVGVERGSETDVLAAAAEHGFAPGKNGIDDLEVIEGIGPKVAAVLRGAGIDSFARLARADIEQLKRVLAEAGGTFRLADPGTWPRQARMCVQGEWAELRRYQDELSGGLERKA